MDLRSVCLKATLCTTSIHLGTLITYTKVIHNVGFRLFVGFEFSLSLPPSLPPHYHSHQQPNVFCETSNEVWDSFYMGPNIYIYAHVDACVSQSIDDILGLNIWITYNILTSSFSWLPHINS